MPTFRKPVVGNDLLPAQPVRSSTKDERPRKRSNFLVPFLVLIVVAAVASAGYFYFKYQKISSENMSQTEVATLVAQVSNHMILPEGELPTVATVIDPTVLQDQPFFLNAQKGDKVLVYSAHKRAILYRPATDKIVEVMPFEVPQAPKS